MPENKQPLDKHDENTDARSTGTSIRTDLARDKNGPTITHQSDAHPADRGMNSGLTRALVGGLIGATLGTLAGALANKRTVKGANYAAIDVGDGVKTVAEGINQAAIGVGNAVKSVAEGVNYAVVGRLVDAVNDTAESAKQSVGGALDAAKGATEDVKLSNNQSSKLNEERLVVIKKQATTGEVGIAEQGETPKTEILVPVDQEPVVEPSIPVDAQNTISQE